jgi:hypothetical protein
MSEATGQPAATQTTGGGSTLLTSEVGTPQGASLDTTQQTTTQATNGTAQATPQGRPDWFPEKFWRDDRPDHEGLAKSYSSLEKLLGSEKIPVVSNWEDKDQADRWYKAAGRPDDAKGYEFTKPDKLPDGFYDETAEQSFRDWAHNNGLNKRQAANLHKAYVKTQLERHAAYQEQQRQTQGRLKADLMREHGAAFEGFSKGANAAVMRYADPDFKAWLDETGMGNDPRMIRVFGRIGKDMMGDTALRGQPKVEVNTADLDKQISEYRSKYSTELHDRAHPEHARHVAAFQKLFELRYPEPPK